MKGYLARVRRAGFDIGLSAAKLTKAMVEVLLQLPPEAPPSKEVVAGRAEIYSVKQKRTPFALRRPRLPSGRLEGRELGSPPLN